MTSWKSGITKFSSIALVDLQAMFPQQHSNLKPLSLFASRDLIQRQATELELSDLPAEFSWLE